MRPKTGITIAAVAIFLFPAEAVAWGPVAHIDFSLQLVAGIAALVPAVQQLIKRYPTEFIYGNLAADAVVGKNLADMKNHCHSWHVAYALLKEARQLGDRYEAFMLGYIGHLGADVVAHNHFIPDRLVANYRAWGVGHLYWEARFDQRLLSMAPHVRNTWLEMSAMCFDEYDQFLAKKLSPTLFSHKVSNHIYKRSLGVQRHNRWQGAFNRIDIKSKLPLRANEIQRWRTVSVAMAALAIIDPTSEELRSWDPTGREALNAAVRHRRMLRHYNRRHKKNNEPNEFLDRNRSAFASIIPHRTV
ncbi:MAG: zinc dependent phospholipase C family protein [Myxococcota bacterium]|nr:zinc dependent phospholipase C family protein [Myxococcota bacterium]